MSQLKRRSLDSKVNTIKADRKESDSETLNEKNQQKNLHLVQRVQKLQVQCIKLV